MTVTLTQDRLKRLVDSGLRGTCRPGERLSHLKEKANEIDGRNVKRLEGVFFALADRTRVMVVELLADEELCSCEIMAALNLTEPTTSHHLGILERAGLIESRREGKWVFYKLASSDVNVLLARGSALVRRAA